ncbi:MAG: phosphatidylethanolamine-binding protein [Candidatus Rokubacteria bacterium GWA2_70_23]|nr:MAG: phosphatidylethanolamine-binding protein [Candidatus Rokubacteria bacterium GWA2_70_23]
MTHKMLVGSVLLTVGLAVSLAVASVTEAQQFKLTSPDIKPNGVIAEEQVFNGFGCSGKNASPALAWSGAPKGTKSLALLVHDPDAPTGGAGWWHWLAVNIPASVTELKKNAGKADGSNLPQGAEQITTDFGGPGWGGPCPPAGEKPHRYNFTLHALKVEKLDLPKGATASLAGFMVNANSVGKATLTGKYDRKK